jgi:ATP-dependent RNA helicase DOB1
LSPQGKTFQEVTRTTNMFEGSLIRVLRRLDELLNQLQKAAKSVGDEELGAKFKAGSKCLKRGIVFASSLYL